MNYYAPWGPERLPASFLEKHCARCRGLELPYETSPHTVAKALETHPERERIEAAAHTAAAALPAMFEYQPPDARHCDPFQDINAWDHLAAFGGRGGGKSHKAAEAIIKEASIRRERVAGAREYMARIKESSKELLEQKIKESQWAADWETTEFELRNRRTGSLIFFIGLAGHNSDSVGKALEGVTILWTDEAQFLTQSSIDIILPTIRAAGSRCLWTWNPPEEPSPVDQLFRGEHPPERSLVGLMQVDENPYLYRTRLASEMRSSFKRDSREKFNHIWRGAYLTITETTVFANVISGYLDWRQFDDLHIEPLGGMDFGYGGPDPSAAVRAYLVQPEQRPDYVPEFTRPLLYVHSEAVERAVPNHKLHELPQRIGLESVLADSAMPLMLDAINATATVAAYPAYKGKGSLMAGLRKLQSCDIMVSPTCPVTYDELTGLRWAMDPRTKKVKTPLAPVGEDHCFTGDTVIPTSLGLRTLESLVGKTGFVISDDGKPHCFDQVRLTRRAAKIVSVTFSDGRTVKCTPDHKFLTPTGWVTASELTGRVIQSVSALPSSYLTEDATISVGRISRGCVMEKKPAGSIATFTKALMDPFLKAITSITSTATVITTHSPILNAFRQRSISPSAIVRPAVYSNIQSPPETLGGLRCSADNVARLFLGIPSNRNTALEIADKNIATSTTRNSQRSNAKSAAKTSKDPTPVEGKLVANSAGIRCVAVTPMASRSDVFCLSVSERQNFALPNGVIAHNCIAALRYALSETEVGQGGDVTHV